ncbi:hypothetical protein [Haloferula sargassicola]|uniref:Oligosaccharide repeat unit polymerase n=1 Tax=Haloferula sargassicola TaxID=490096 RepID=A0ABP9UQ61_9BACT
MSVGLCLYPTISVLLKRDLKLLLSALVIANLAPIWFLHLEGVLSGRDAKELLSPAVRIGGFIWANVYSAIFNCLYRFFLKTTSKALHRSAYIWAPDPQSSLLGLAAIAMFWIPIAIIGQRYESLEQLWWSLTAGRTGGEMGVLLRVTSVGGSNSFYLPLMWAFQLVPLVSAMALDSHLRQQNHPVIPWIATCFGLMVIGFYLLGGSRGQFIQIVAGPLGLLIFRVRNRGYVAAIIALVSFFLLIGIMELQVRQRGNLLELLSRDNIRPGTAVKNREITTFNPLESHRDNNLYFLCLIVDRIPKQIDYDGFNSLFIDLVNPIPRALWKDKPSHHDGDLSARNADAIYNSGPLQVGTSSISCTVVGEFYKMGGIWGLVVIAAIYSFLQSYTDIHFLRARRLTTFRVGVQAISVFFALWGFRAFGTFLNMGYPLMMLVIVLVIGGKLVRAPSSNASKKMHKESNGNLKCQERAK